jgi:hypothetical protein
MIKTNNPAGRLYDVLSEARNHPTSQGVPAKKIWSSVFGVDSDSTLLIRRLVQLTEEMDEATERLKQLENFTLALHLPQLQSLRHALSPTHLNSNWEHVARFLSESSMLSLASAADWLAHHDPDGEINKSDLDALQREIEELVRVVLDSKSDIVFRQFVLEQLEKIRSAILEYRIRGPVALREALEYTTGALVLNHTLVKEQADRKDGSILRRFEKVVSTTHTLVTTIAKFHQLAEPLIRLLSM